MYNIKFDSPYLEISVFKKDFKKKLKISNKISCHDVCKLWPSMAAALWF